MDPIENRQDQSKLTTDTVHQTNENDHAYVAIKVANAKLSIANLENQKLKQTIEQKQEIIQQNKRTIEELQRRLEQQEKTQSLNQWKISEMSQQLIKVQQLLKQLLQKKKSITYTFQFGKYSTPNLKRSLVDKIKIKQREVYQDSFYINSGRSAKTQYISPQSYTNYQKSIKSPTSYNRYESEQYKRYRIQKLKACNNLDDVLKIQKMID